MGMIRKAIVAAGLFAVLPMPPQDGSQPAGQTRPAPGTIAYVAAASETYSDVAGFCQRQPMACDVGQYIATTAQAKAKYSAKIIYEWANAEGQTAKPALAPNGETAEALAIPVPVERPQHLMAPQTQLLNKS